MPKHVEIRPHNGGPVEIITAPEDTPTHVVVERWQRAHYRWAWARELAPCTYRVLDAGDIVGALIESARR